jgi:opacity protein-like surface antigen
MSSFRTCAFRPSPKLRNHLAQATLLTSGLLMSSAWAQSTASRWYVQANLGASSVSDPAASLVGSPSGRLSLGSGQTNGGALGLRLGPHLRAELEVSHRGNKLRSATAGGVDAAQPDADYAALFVFANVLYDFADWRTGLATFRPYVGLGLGRAQEIDTDLYIGGAAREFSGSKGATQWLVGVNWDYSSRWSAGLGLRGTRVGSVTLRGTGPATGQTLHSSYRGSTVVASLGYRF